MHYRYSTAIGHDACERAIWIQDIARAALASVPVADPTGHEIGALWASTPNPGHVVAFARALLSKQASAPVAGQAQPACWI